MSPAKTREIEKPGAEQLVVRYASPLAADALLILAEGDAGAGVEARLIDAPADLETESRSFSLPPLREAKEACLVALTAGFGVLHGAQFVLVSADGDELTAPLQVRDLTVEPRTLIRTALAGFDGETRSEILEFVVEAFGRTGSHGDRVTLARNLNLFRSALREPSPSVVIAEDEPSGLHVDSLIRLDEHSLFIRGWMRDSQGPITGLRVLSPEGEWISILDQVTEVSRPDVLALYGEGATRQKPGFLGRFESRSASVLTDGWILESENSLGIKFETAAPRATTDPIAARAEIIAQLAHERTPDTPLLDRIVPAVSSIQGKLSVSVEIEDDTTFGAVPVDPELSVVVPLYGRIDLLEHQLAQFTHDPEFQRVELIYVLDSPDLAPALGALAPHLHDLYGVPFRVLELSRNGGFSVANNLGVEAASGELVVLLNSDVIPIEPGWLGSLASSHRSRERAGATGPKLLFEDDSLQHAGLFFRRPAPGMAWENAHYFKGLHRSLPAANVPRRVPAVTGACLMIERELYAELGGLSESYIQGDYEDSDLCLRLHSRDREVWYEPSVELYHLEGRSYGLGARQTTARYNSWLHTRLWGKAIEELMREQDSDAGG